MGISEVEIITLVRSVRKIVVSLDSLGFPMSEISKDVELSELVPLDMPQRVKDLASEIHEVLQNIEKSKNYRNSIKIMCVKEEYDG